MVGTWKLRASRSRYLGLWLTLFSFPGLEVFAHFAAPFQAGVRLFDFGPIVVPPCGRRGAQMQKPSPADRGGRGSGANAIPTLPLDKQEGEELQSGAKHVLGPYGRFTDHASTQA